eukprot:Transcript_7251.p2 GENE.Transcript_7251~~Transcript_7251.p2  ORF type:complete len:342 (+),score=110.06 Transcript_7251:102-1127(+)
MARAVAPAPNPDGSVPLLAGHNQNVGGRKQQEDRCYCVPDLNPLGRKRHPDLDETRRALFCVFDGFGGDQSSEWLKNHFHINLTEHQAFATDPQQALLETFATTDEELLKFMDSQDKKKGSGPALVRCGSCATVCLVVGNQAYVANLGDSSCVLYRRTAAGGALAEMLSVDHKASVQSERDRIAAAGGRTEQKTQNVAGFLCWPAKTVPVGPVRVQPGGLAVSRAFGAGHAKLERFNGKPGCVVSAPAMRAITLDESMLCVVLASDGVWDNVKDVKDLHFTLKRSITMSSDVKKTARYAAEAVVDYSIRRSPNAEGQDNTTAIVVVVGAEAAAAAAVGAGP